MTQSLLDPQLEQSAFGIRPAEYDDLAICSQLVGSYQTDYVWQMQFREEERQISAAFSRIRLPRTMSVNYPYSAEELSSIFSRSDFLFVAAYQDNILGCIDGVLDQTHRRFTIHNLIIQSVMRRQGLGRLLFKTAQQAALYHSCEQMSVLIQTKNHPAIEFVQKAGFVYCGYNDRYYNNGDIALIFSLML
jgi:ribosomal protein S18 acetylase RimI-like enzyme